MAIYRTLYRPYGPVPALYGLVYPPVPALYGLVYPPVPACYPISVVPGVLQHRRWVGYPRYMAGSSAVPEYGRYPRADPISV